jgi:hypothetical protein
VRPKILQVVVFALLACALGWSLPPAAALEADFIALGDPALR